MMRILMNGGLCLALLLLLPHTANAMMWSPTTTATTTASLKSLVVSNNNLQSLLSKRKPSFLPAVPAMVGTGSGTALQVSSLSSSTLSLFRGGGGCSDTTPILFLKVGVSAILQTLALLGVLKAGAALTEKIEKPKLLAKVPKQIFQWLSIGLVVFGSSLFGSIIDGGMSAATQQAMDPNVVPGDPDWYANLIKPWWNPPGFVFPIMWLLVSKPTQAVALTKLFGKVAEKEAKQQSSSKKDEKKEGGSLFPWKQLGVYCAHLALGDAWNKVFFGFQCIGRGTTVITAFFGMLLTSTKLFFDVEPMAGKFMLPTCGWVAIATALNWSIYFLN